MNGIVKALVSEAGARRCLSSRLNNKFSVGEGRILQGIRSARQKKLHLATIVKTGTDTTLTSSQKDMPSDAEPQTGDHEFPPSLLTARFPQGSPLICVQGVVVDDGGQPNEQGGMDKDRADLTVHTMLQDFVNDEAAKAPADEVARLHTLPDDKLFRDFDRANLRLETTRNNDCDLQCNIEVAA